MVDQPQHSDPREPIGQGTPTTEKKGLVKDVLGAVGTRILAQVTVANINSASKVLKSQANVLEDVNKLLEIDIATSVQFGKTVSDVADTSFGKDSKFSRLFRRRPSDDKLNYQAFFKEVLFDNAILAYTENLPPEEGVSIKRRITFLKSGIPRPPSYGRWKQDNPQERIAIRREIDGEGVVDEVTGIAGTHGMPGMLGGGFKKIRRKGNRASKKKRRTKKRRTKKRRTKKRRTKKRRTKKRRTKKRKIN